MILTPSTREHMTTLLDAAIWSDDAPDQIAFQLIASDAPALTVTRRGFFDSSRRYASALMAVGVRPRDLVVIAHADLVESVAAFWGALIMGAIPSMLPTLTEKLDPAIYQRHMAELVRLSNVRAIITDQAHVSMLAHYLVCPVYGSDSLLTHASAICDVSHVASAQEIAFLQHSSGTTGLQKGVALSHEAVLNQLASYAEALSLDDQDVIVSWLPLYHDMGLIAGFIQPLVQGIPLVLMSPFDWVAHPALLLRAIHDHHATLCWLPNFAYNHMAGRVRAHDSDGLDLSSMRAFVNCSEPVRHDSHHKFIERFAPNGVRANQLAVSYAMAENTFAVTQTRTGEAPTIDWVDQQAIQTDLQAISIPSNTLTAMPQVSCGRVIANTTIKIVDLAGHTLPERHIGEIFVKSDCMLAGYYHRPDLQPFDADGWYATGDKGYLADGELYVIGRSKDLIINAGKNVYPSDIEAALADIDGVHPGRAVVFGIADEREGTELIAVVAEVDTDDAAVRKRINQTIRGTIARRSEITVTFVTLVEKGWLIKTSSGKIARGANRDKWREQFGER